MGVVCAVTGCKSPRGETISYHRFPLNDDDRRQWLKLCKKKEFVGNVDHLKVCSRHFEADAFERNLKYELLGLPLPRNLKKLKEGVFPTLYLPGSKGNSEAEIKEINKRKERAERRVLKRTAEELINESIKEDEALNKKLKSANQATPTIESANQATAKIKDANQATASAKELATKPGQSSKVVTSGQSHVPNNPELINQIKSGNGKEVEQLRQSHVAINPEKYGHFTEVEQLQGQVSMLERKVLSLTGTVQSLQSEIIHLRRTTISREMAESQLHTKVECLLRTVFSKTQIKVLVSGKPVSYWPDEDILSCSTILKISPKCYRYLKLKGYPLPGANTLKVRLKNIQDAKSAEKSQESEFLSDEEDNMQGNISTTADERAKTVPCGTSAAQKIPESEVESYSQKTSSSTTKENAKNVHCETSVAQKMPGSETRNEAESCSLNIASHFENEKGKSSHPKTGAAQKTPETESYSQNVASVTAMEKGRTLHCETGVTQNIPDLKTGIKVESCNQNAESCSENQKDKTSYWESSVAPKLPASDMANKDIIL